MYGADGPGGRSRGRRTSLESGVGLVLEGGGDADCVEEQGSAALGSYDDHDVFGRRPGVRERGPGRLVIEIELPVIFKLRVKTVCLFFVQVCIPSLDLHCRE